MFTGKPADETSVLQLDLFLTRTIANFLFVIKHQDKAIKHLV